MVQPRTLALDAMGGDHGPEVVVPGAAISLERHPALSFIFCGDEARIAPILEKHPALKAKSRIQHTALAVNMHDKPSQALRRGKGTSMWLALEAVKTGEAHAAVSGGNTGALMAMGKFILRPMSGIERPAMAALWPTVTAECIVLDVGANIGASVAPARRLRLDGCRDGPRDLPRRAPDCRPAQRRRRGDQGRRRGQGSERAAQDPCNCRSTIAASSRATRSARARSTWSWSKASPATSR